MPDLALTNTLASYGTLLLLFGTALSLGALAGMRIPTSLARILARYGLALAAALSAFAVTLTLYYSEVLGQAPCSLCWVQRVFLYPQVLLFGIAALRSDTRIVLYTTALSLVGAVTALYHHALQVGGISLAPCAATGPQCTEVTFLTWGFITFPFMAFALFVFLIAFTALLTTLWQRFPQAKDA